MRKRTNKPNYKELSDEEEEEEEIDYFAPLDDDEDSLDAKKADMRFNDFFGPPPKEDEIAEALMKKRKVQFNEDLQVKQIPARKRRKGESMEEYLGLVEPKDDDDDDDDDEDDGDYEEANLNGEADDDDENEGGSSTEEEDGEEDDEDDEEGEDGEDGSEYEDSDEDEENNGKPKKKTKTDKMMDRVKGDLFADGDDESDDDEDLTEYEQRIQQLGEEIASYEDENVGEKDWTLKGEARSKDRPVNSLLEEDLEFEHVGKITPTVTAESTASIEEIIKRRVVEQNFDDVVRRRIFEPAAYLPSRLLELSGTQSQKSLAEIYEDEASEARQRAEGKQVVHEVDEKLKKEHDEIKKFFDDVCGKMDALSNAHYTPKAPETNIETISNVASASLESALPTANSTASMLAPEEIYANGKQENASKDEMTPSEKRKQRRKNRKQKAVIQKQTDKLSGAAAAKSGSRSKQKQQAINQIKNKKGVSIAGTKPTNNKQQTSSIANNNSGSLKL